MHRITRWQRQTDGRLYSDSAVMNLLLQGNTRTEISEKLNMPLGTVNTCCTRIYKQADCKSLVELIIKHDRQKSRGDQPPKNPRN